MGLVLDSSVLIAAERQSFDMVAFIETEAPMQPIYISAVTASELLHGVYRATPEHRARRETFVQSILRETPVIAFDVACADKHARLWAKLQEAGTMIGAHDLIIAATCLAYSHRIATLNEKEFARAEGLTLVDARKYTVNR